jgi:hypothetical protein
MVRWLTLLYALYLNVLLILFETLARFVYLNIYALIFLNDGAFHFEDFLET